MSEHISLPKIEVKVVPKKKNDVVLEINGLGDFYMDHEVPTDVMHNILDIIKRYNKIALKFDGYLTNDEINICKNHILLYIKEEINAGKIRKIFEEQL